MDAHSTEIEAQALAATFGLKATFFDDVSGENINGAYLPHVPGRIFIDAGTDNPFHAVAGHELTHAMEHEAPDLYRAYHDAVMKHVGDRSAFDQERLERGYSAGNLGLREGLGDDSARAAIKNIVGVERAMQKALREFRQRQYSSEGRSDAHFARPDGHVVDQRPPNRPPDYSVSLFRRPAGLHAH